MHLNRGVISSLVGNNAGIHYATGAKAKYKSKQGYDMAFATNYGAFFII